MDWNGTHLESKKEAKVVDFSEIEKTAIPIRIYSTWEPRCARQYYIEYMENGNWIPIQKRHRYGLVLASFDSIVEAEDFLKNKWDGQEVQPMGTVEKLLFLKRN